MQRNIQQLPIPILKKIFSLSIDSKNLKSLSTFNRVNRAWHTILDESKFNSAAKRMAQMVASKKFFDTSLAGHLLHSNSDMGLFEQRKAGLKNTCKDLFQHISHCPKALQLALLREAADEAWEASPSYEGDAALETAKAEIMHLYAEAKNPLNNRTPADEGAIVAYIRLLLAEEITKIAASSTVQEFAEISLAIRPDPQSFERLDEVDPSHRDARERRRSGLVLMVMMIALIPPPAFAYFGLEEQWVGALIAVETMLLVGIPFVCAIFSRDRSNLRVAEYYRRLNNNPFTLFHSNEEKKADDEKKEADETPSPHSTYGSFSPHIP